MDKLTRKLGRSLDVSQEDAGKLVKAGIRLPREARKSPKAVEKALGKGKADKVKAKLNP